jgi:hypothetical protein
MLVLMCRSVLQPLPLTMLSVNNIAAYHIKMPFKNFRQSIVCMFGVTDFVLILGAAMCGSGCVENYSQNWELACFMLKF